MSTTTPGPDAQAAPPPPPPRVSVTPVESRRPARPEAKRAMIGAGVAGVATAAVGVVLGGLAGYHLLTRIGK